jgi:hypothetical protein
LRGGFLPNFSRTVSIHAGLMAFRGFLAFLNDEAGSLAVDAEGNLYVADLKNHRIRYYPSTSFIVVDGARMIALAKAILPKL